VTGLDQMKQQTGWPRLILYPLNYAIRIMRSRWSPLPGIFTRPYFHDDRGRPARVSQPFWSSFFNYLFNHCQKRQIFPCGQRLMKTEFATIWRMKLHCDTM
jgi:hypothetical protein